MNFFARTSLLALLAAAPLLPACTVHETRVVEPSGPAPRPMAAHPAYLHALSDLRDARFNLERKGGDAQMRWDERDAIGDVDRAIAEIKQASIDDGKNLNDHPAVDAREPRLGRLHRALAALRTARGDIEREEDNGYANGLKGRAIQHIDEAIRRTEEGVSAAEHAS